MSLWAIVPVKPFWQAKSRLAAVLSPEERASLSRAFLRRALSVLVDVPRVARTFVISRDVNALALAREMGMGAIAEVGLPDLNTALQQGIRVAQDSGAGAVLILPSDLPHLSTGDVHQLVSLAESKRTVVIAPDRHATGTNALLLQPPNVIAPAFGPGSFERHLALAARAGVRARICRRPGLALDVDAPDDLHLYQLAQKI